ncbi:MAG: glycosyltransferase family 39 protein, partial [Chloroflexota bacterium]|nr:glycosyltransferase family 39 protein [Chloroflexota bacterium]
MGNLGRNAMPYADVSKGNGRPGKRQALTGTLVLLLAFGLRLVQLGAGSIWYDESVSIYLAGLDLPAMVAHTAGDIHPPLYYALLHFWTLAAGQTEFSAAFFSLFFGLLLVALTQRVASRLAGSWAGWLAALLVAVSPFNVWYSQEIRMYTLGSFLALLSTHFMTRLLDERPNASQVSRRGAWLGYVLSTAAGIYSLYYFFFLLIFHNLYAGFRLLAPRARSLPSPEPSRCPPFLSWLSAQAALFLFYLPWLPVAFHQATQPPVPPWRGLTAPWDALVESWTALSLGQSAEPTSLWPLLLALVGVYALGVVSLAKDGPSAGDASHATAGILRPAGDGATAGLLVGYTLIPLATILAVSAFIPLYHVRYAFTYAAAFYIVLAAGLDHLRRWRGAALAIVLVVFAAGCALSLRSYFTSPAYAADDHRSAVQFLADRWRPGDAILVNAGYVYPAVLYYYDSNIAWRGRLHDYTAPPSQAGAVLLQTGSIGGSPQLGWGSPSSDFYATTEVEMAADLDRVARLHPRLWVYRCYDTVTDPNETVRNYLDQHFLKLEDVGFAGS